MAEARCILAIDQGTTSTRALIFDGEARVLATAQVPLAQHYPAEGWVEHDAEDIWRDTLAVARQAIAQAGIGAADIAGIGITNQRETSLLWDRATGAPLHRAIVWQDRRTADACAALRAAGHEPLVQARTGLLLDPYFSATKIGWLLDHVPGARERAARGEIAFGTVDSFLLWRLTGGKVHATDATNAARTALFDIRRRRWCPDMLALFGIPEQILPRVKDSDHRFGETEAVLFGTPIPIHGIAGDQHAALIGQGRFAPGTAKATFGTGGFILIETGETPVPSANRLLTTIGHCCGGRPSYALEGSIFVAGAAIKWLRDGLGLIGTAAETARLAAGLADNGGVHLVPAFVGLGAPHWDADARGLLSGLTLATTPAHIARAALEAVAYQTADLIAAMTADGAPRPAVLRVDGGMAANDWLCRFLADVAGVPIERPHNVEATALGAAMLAGLGTGFWRDRVSVAHIAAGCDRFQPNMDHERRNALLLAWHRALARARS